MRAGWDAYFGRRFVSTLGLFYLSSSSVLVDNETVRQKEALVVNLLFPTVCKFCRGSILLLFGFVNLFCSHSNKQSTVSEEEDDILHGTIAFPFLEDQAPIGRDAKEDKFVIRSAVGNTEYESYVLHKITIFKFRWQNLTRVMSCSSLVEVKVRVILTSLIKNCLQQCRDWIKEIHAPSL